MNKNVSIKVCGGNVQMNLKLRVHGNVSVVLLIEV
jgi:hypothetical protein